MLLVCLNISDLLSEIATICTSWNEPHMNKADPFFGKMIHFQKLSHDWKARTPPACRLNHAPPSTTAHCNTALMFPNHMKDLGGTGDREALLEKKGTEGNIKTRIIGPGKHIWWDWSTYNYTDCNLYIYRLTNPIIDHPITNLDRNILRGHQRTYWAKPLGTWKRLLFYIKLFGLPDGSHRMLEFYPESLWVWAQPMRDDVTL